MISTRRLLLLANRVFVTGKGRVVDFLVLNG